MWNTPSCHDPFHGSKDFSAEKLPFSVSLSLYGIRHQKQLLGTLTAILSLEVKRKGKYKWLHEQVQWMLGYRPRLLLLFHQWHCQTVIVSPNFFHCHQGFSENVYWQILHQSWDVYVVKSIACQRIHLVFTYILPRLKNNPHKERTKPVQIHQNLDKSVKYKCWYSFSLTLFAK